MVEDPLIIILEKERYFDLHTDKGRFYPFYVAKFSFVYNRFKTLLSRVGYIHVCIDL